MLQAIEEHKYLQSCEHCLEVDILDAIREFRHRHQALWLEDKIRADNLDQVSEITRHLWAESQKAGHDIGRTNAGLDWVTNYAGEWRNQRESLSTNRFVGIRIDLPGEDLFGPEDLTYLVEEVSLLYCDAFISQPGLGRPHFFLQIDEDRQEPFVLIAPRTLDRILSVRLPAGETLEIIAYGEDADSALDLTRRIVQAPRIVTL